MAYVDDVIIFVTSAANFAIIEGAIHLYERASGERFNLRKSNALAAGSWCTQETVLGIAYHRHVTILGSLSGAQSSKRWKTPGQG